MRLIALALVATLGLALDAEAQSQRPIRPPAAATEEERYAGVDFASWLVVQSLGSTTETIQRGGTGSPVCVPWEVVVSFRAEDTTCWCWTLDPNVQVAAPTGDGGCQISDDNGRDGDGACFATAANETAWGAPAWQVVPARAGARGYAGAPGGLCTVATTTTAGFGSALRVPCRVTADCTAVVGSGTCEAFASPVPSTDGRTTSSTSRDEQYGRGCAYVRARSAGATVAFVGGKR